MIGFLPSNVESLVKFKIRNEVNNSKKKKHIESITFFSYNKILLIKYLKKSHVSIKNSTPEYIYLLMRFKHVSNLIS
jgi:hypothetical protein